MQFTDQEIKSVLDLDEVRIAVEEGLRRFSAGLTDQPMRTMVKVPEAGGFLGVMPAYVNSLGMKIVTFYPTSSNPMPYSKILLFNPQDGQFAAIMDAHYITNVRTAAVSASAVRLLAKPDARTLAIIGAGHLAQSHLAALRRVRDFDEVRVWSPKSAAAFAERNGVTFANSTRDAVQGADVVVAATSSTTPVLEGNWLESDCLVCTVGAPRPDWRELDDETLARADGRVVVDSRQAALAESGDVKAAGRVYAELGEIIGGKAAPLTSESGIVIFKSLGMAVQDIVTAELAYKKLVQ